MSRLSPGIANACIELVDILSTNRLSAIGVGSMGKLGVVDATTAFNTAKEVRWVDVDAEGWLIPLPAGFSALRESSYENRLRRLISDFIDAFSPAWVQLATSGRRKVLMFAGSEIAQVFSEAGLAYGDGPDVVVFWDLLAARARGLRNAKLLDIGRQGERLTINFERSRTGKSPKWISLDSNDDGYDVLSIVGGSNFSPMPIEVKATSVKGGAFHVTRNEWERANESKNYLFHLWNISSSAQLAIISGKEMTAHVPNDQGRGEWESFRVPFSAFKEAFFEVGTLIT